MILGLLLVLLLIVALTLLALFNLNKKPKNLCAKANSCPHASTCFSQENMICFKRKENYYG